MEKPEYQYDENLSAAKNIAAGLFAIANEIGRLIDNNFEQSKKTSSGLKEGLSVIAQELEHIFESYLKKLKPQSNQQSHTLILTPLV